MDNWNEPMWEREKKEKSWDPSKSLLKSVRDYQRLKKSKLILKIIPMKFCVLRNRFWCVVTGAKIDVSSSNIGGGLLIPHPNGIVIDPRAHIGANCLMFQQVTVGPKVTLGNHVDVGAGAKLLGNITIGDNVRIGANAVVKKDVEAGKTVVGIPAREISSSNL